MRALRTVVLALAAALLVAGCSEDPEPRIGTAPSPSAATASASESAPVEVEQETPEAFIQRWFDAGVGMQETGKTKDFEALNAACDPCDDLAATVRGYYEEGGFIRPALVEVISATPVSNRTSEFDVKTTSGPTTVKESSKAEPKELVGGPETYTIRLKSDGKSWRMTAYLLEIG